MGRGGALLKLSLLAAPLAAGAVTLHAAGEPAGRAARKMIAVASYPAHDHGRFSIRVRRGSDYHEHAARTLEKFTRERVSGGAVAKLPARVTVLVLEKANELERFGLDLKRLDRGGLVDGPSWTIALVTGGRVYNPEQDARILRREMARLLFARASSPWLVSGIGSYFETVPPGAADGFVRFPVEELLDLSALLAAPQESFREPAGVRPVESARLLVAFLWEEERQDLLSLLEGGTAILRDLSSLEERWREWVRRVPPKRTVEPREGGPK
jgi:hypothetical protein